MRIEIIETTQLGTQQLAAGVQLVLDAEQARKLIDSGHARLVATASGDEPVADHSSSDNGDGNSEPESRHALIVGAIRDLLEADPERADESTWTKSGKPDVKALESLLGFDISAAERDAAWDEVNG